jgi:hypothetical protein
VAPASNHLHPYHLLFQGSDCGPDFRHWLPSNKKKEMISTNSKKEMEGKAKIYFTTISGLSVLIRLMKRRCHSSCNSLSVITACLRDHSTTSDRRSEINAFKDDFVSITEVHKSKKKKASFISFSFLPKNIYLRILDTFCHKRREQIEE